MAFESPRFGLPIRLGTVNAAGKQDLYVYALTRTGRVETANYRTVRLPSNVEIPEFVAEDFDDFYRAMFARALDQENGRAVFLEYAWDMAWCDPCAADPLSRKELRELGVFWLPDSGGRRASPAQDVFVTRLHLRYDQATFPADLRFQETGDRGNFQGRYVVRRAWEGALDCAAGAEYSAVLSDRHDAEARQLAALTGWSLADIRERMPAQAQPSEPRPWWRRLWGEG